MRKISKAAVLVAALILVLVVATVAYVQLFSPKKLRIGFLQSDLHQLAFFVAVEKELLKKENIEFDYFAYENGVKEMEAFKAGAIDVGYLGIAPASYRAVKEDVNITIVAGANAEGSAIVARSSFTVNSVGDLAGKTVAIPAFNTVQDVLLRLALREHGLTYANLTGGVPSTMSVSQMPTALREGVIDAYIAWEPFCAKSLASGDGVVVVNGSSHEIWPGHPCCVLAVRSQFLAENADLVKRVVKVHVEATRWIEANFEEAVEVAARWTNLPEETVELALGRIAFLYKPSVEGVKQYIRYLVEFEALREDEIDGGIDLFVQRFVNTQIVEEVE